MELGYFKQTSLKCVDCGSYMDAGHSGFHLEFTLLHTLLLKKVCGVCLHVSSDTARCRGLKFAGKVGFNLTVTGVDSILNTDTAAEY